ncbi:immunoglobulin alpha-2 heavy chain-like [Peromyscus californicus insignis]|uniref:immunoglobulin alpha-2 heavy chain-like n=1 Tax=Peromyscus californicus insignis TaxID=564181 RepID=UPI0022A7D560|nr:immunoglobulin alpha-2 heavy chain-like [Peromyscus californicus insignis]
MRRNELAIKKISWMQTIQLEALLNKEQTVNFYYIAWLKPNKHVGLGQLEPIEISVTRAVSQSAQISCKVSLQGFDTVDIHWYRQKTNQPFEYLIYIRNDNTHRPLEGISKKIEAKKDFQTSTATLIINSLKKEDEAIYYCKYPFHKVFSKGTKLIVIPSDKHFGSDVSPKPTIFLPSVAETNLHKAGTYLCLLEKFFPDVIRVYWKEKDGDKILKSQEGNSMKTNDTYMKLSWLTVTEDSMDKEHKCIVKHENNRGGVDQEILFPPIDKVANIISPTEAYLKTENVSCFPVLTVPRRAAKLQRGKVMEEMNTWAVDLRNGIQNSVSGMQRVQDVHSDSSGQRRGPQECDL